MAVATESEEAVIEQGNWSCVSIIIIIIIIILIASHFMHALNVIQSFSQ